MNASDIPRAVAAAVATATEAGLAVDDTVVLQDSNRITMRLLPCDVLVRVAHVRHEAAPFEIELAQRLAAAGSPVALLDPRVEPLAYERDGFVVTFWTYYEPATAPLTPGAYANALERLHAGMRTVHVPTPHFTERVASAQHLIARPELTPDLADPERDLLGALLRTLRDRITGRGAAEQLLHGEPHPGNLLATTDGPLFIDLETCCRGPVEFDVAHAPEGVGDHYPGLDQELLRDCRTLVLAIVTTWRWDRDDQLPDGRRLAAGWLDQIRTALDRHPLDLHH
ncbi:phosphotransferase [Actinocatenispora rupis]|uniref:Aminoglycoside phosphotransferase n=1 Tax=Actinocatenispora rupis TaxID=519421 RepID=A0A8J3J8Z4_9ACTN|nr:aminoglycoside phosphotransferase family protein [Actinocatenispora rupis]GID12309.1 aminoglycoside phosphotransferase [Actinocatenispora rupis]